MNFYRVIEGLNYNELFAEINIELFGTLQDVRVANDTIRNIRLYNGVFKAEVNGQEYIINNADRNLYKFQICTKFIKPLDMTKKDSVKYLLTHMEEYMTEPEDYMDVPLDLEGAYATLCQTYGEKEVFKFDSIYYGVEKLVIRDEERKWISVMDELE